jgi:hypothetical protein
MTSPADWHRTEAARIEREAENRRRIEERYQLVLPRWGHPPPYSEALSLPGGIRSNSSEAQHSDEETKQTVLVTTKTPIPDCDTDDDRPQGSPTQAFCGDSPNLTSDEDANLVERVTANLEEVMEHEGAVLKQLTN